MSNTEIRGRRHVLCPFCARQIFDRHTQKRRMAVAVLQSSRLSVEMQKYAAPFGFIFRAKLSSFLPLEYALACPAGQKLDFLARKMNRITHNT
jgi:hypothetical protein